MKTIYLDNAATTPMLPEVVEEMQKHLADYGNPSAAYQLGMHASDLIEEARCKVAYAINAYPGEIYFTSGGSEADNWALISGYEAAADKNQIITTKIEHHAILNTCEYLERRGADVVYLDVNQHGRVDVKDLEYAISDQTALVSIMYANNEIGTINRIDSLSRIADKKGILFHTDAVQAFGHVAIDVANVPIDMLSASAHKIGGPKGIGCLYIRNGTTLPPYLHGGGQERGLRASTENVLGIIGFGKAAEITLKNMFERNKYVIDLRNYLGGRILSEIPDCYLNGDPTLRLANNLNITFSGIRGEQLLRLLDMNGICVSTGSACNSDSDEPSHVLKAIGLSDDDANASIRFTLSYLNTKDEIDFVINVLKRSVEQLRGKNG